MEIITPEERIKQLQQLEERDSHIRQRATWAAWASVALAALVLGGLILGATRTLANLNKQLKPLNDQLQTKQGEIKGMQETIEGKKKELSQLEDKISATLNKDASEQQRAAAINQLALSIPGRVYVQVTDESDRASANLLKDDLKAAGFKLLGVECRGDAISIIKVADVRYYKTKDKDAASRLVETVKNATNQDVKLKYLSQYENDPRVHQNDFELWLPHKGTEVSGCEPGRK
jgi:hypothetical protein